MQQPDKYSLKTRLLRITLLASAVAWGVSLAGIFLPWDMILIVLTSFGAQNIPDDPMFTYWLRMTFGTYGGIGIFFFILATDPFKYSNVLPIAGLLMLLEGIVILVYGIMLHLKPVPFYFDTAFCILAGAIIFILGRKEMPKPQ